MKGQTRGKGILSSGAGRTHYDIAFIGHYTKDTIVTSSGVRVVDGGAFNYGAQATARMGLKVAACTRLSKEDFHVLDELKQLGVEVFARSTPSSTCLRLEYTTADVDERTIYVTGNAGPFTPREVRDLEARLFVIGTSIRGEVNLEVIEELAKKNAAIAADVQGFVRVARQVEDAQQGSVSSSPQGASSCPQVSSSPQGASSCPQVSSSPEGGRGRGKLVYEEWPEKRAVLARVDILKTDAVEAEILTGRADIRAAAKMLSELGPQEIVLTHRDGVLIYAEGRFHEEGFFPEKMIGRSGRGDTCLASYAAKRLSASPAEAAKWAAALTSLKMEAEGPFRRNLGEVEDLLRERYRG